MRRFVEENTRQIQDQEGYEQRFQELGAACRAAEALIASTKDEILSCGARKESIRRYLNELKRTGDIVTEFDEDLWQATVASVTVHPDKAMTFVFRDNTEIQVKLLDQK